MEDKLSIQNYDPKKVKIKIFDKELCTEAEWEDYIKAFRETKEELDETKKILEAYQKEYGNDLINKLKGRK